MDSSLGFGSTARHSRPDANVRPVALVRLAVATAGGVAPVAWRRTVTRRFVLQKARRHASSRRTQSQHAPTVCQRTVSGSVSLRLTRCFSPFPHGTGALSVVDG